MKTVFMLVPYRGLMLKSIDVPDEISAKKAVEIYNSGDTSGYDSDSLDAEVTWSGVARLHKVEKI